MFVSRLAYKAGKGREQKMFEKKNVIFSEKTGVCVVHDVTKLTDDHGHAMNYYVLKNVFDKSKVAYIPVEGHQVVLRDLISVDEAVEKYALLQKKNGRTEDGNDENPQNRDDVKSVSFSDSELEELAYLLKRKKEDLNPKEEV